LTLNIIVILKCGLEITQDHWKWRGSTDHVWLSISPR